MVAVGLRLEEYTVQYPREVLLVTIEVQGEPDQIAIFKGFSSSLISFFAEDSSIAL